MVQSLERTQAQLGRLPNLSALPASMALKNDGNTVHTSPRTGRRRLRLFRQEPRQSPPANGSRSQGSQHRAVTEYGPLYRKPEDHSPATFSVAPKHRSAKKACIQMLTSRLPVPGSGSGLSDRHGWEYRDPNRPTSSRPAVLPLTQGAGVSGGSASFSPASSCSSNPSVAASFFARAAQKLNITSRRKKKHHPAEPEPAQFPTNFGGVIQLNPPPAPPCLLRPNTRLQNPVLCKVKVMLRICPVDVNRTNSFLSVDPTKKVVTVYDPANSGYVLPSHRRNGVTAPKMFGFDGVFSQDDSLAELCATSLVEIVQVVVGGADGCLFSYGHARLGKTYTMLGVDDSPQNLGVIPCAIAWLFRLINEQKEKTGARFSVRVSAVEVTGKEERLKDLLSHVATNSEAGSGTAPGVYLKDDPITGTQLENQSELRAPTAQCAAYYLDAAIAARTIPEVEEDARNSHMLFTLHVYQYQLDKVQKGISSGVAGGRSRLHLVDLGSCSKGKDGKALSLQALGNVLWALLNGQRHVPYRESKLTQLMRESLGNLSCRTCMIAHVSPTMAAYNETLHVIQLAAKIHRMKRRRMKFSSTSSDDSSSCDESGRFRRTRMGRIGIRMGTLREDTMYTSALSCSDHDYTSSSEQSCDTVIYVGPNGQMLSDRELTDNEGPPPVGSMIFRPSPLTCHRGYGGSKSSGDEGMASMDGRSTLSDGEGYVRKSAPKCGASALYSRHALKNSVDSSTLERMKLRTKAFMSPKHRGTDINAPEQWIDGPAISAATCVPCTEAQQTATPSRGVNAHRSSHTVEQWVDGPNVARDANCTKSSALGERWIDGPNVQSHAAQTKHLTGELWVDGPREFRVNRGGAVSGQVDGTKGLAHETQCVESNASLGNNTLDVGSSTSLAVEPDSRPVSMQGVDVPDHQVTPMPNLCGREEEGVNDNECTSSFVRDWLDKHRVVPSSGTTGESRSPHHRSSHRGSDRGKSPRQPSMDDMLFGETNRKHEKSPKSERRKHHKSSSSKPDASPVPSRHSQTSHANRHLTNGCVVPPGANDRTAAWVQSVQQTICATKPMSTNGSVLEMPSELPANITDAVAPPCDSCSGSLYVECVDEQTLDMDIDSVSASQLRTEDATVEAKTAEEGTQCASVLPSGWYTPAELGLHVCVTDQSTCEPDRDDVRNDVSGSVDLSNRQSIYEIQMDEQLEEVRCGDSPCRIARDNVSSFQQQLLDRTVCDDTDVIKTVASSTLTKPAENDICDLSQDGVNQDRYRCLATENSGNASPPSSEESKYDDRPVLPSSLRRPDGASNPNLSTADPVKPALHSPEYIMQSVLTSKPAAVLSTSKSTLPYSGETTVNYALINRSVEGQCCQDSVCSSSNNLPPRSPTKPTAPTKPSGKPSVLPKPNSRSGGCPREKPQVPVRTSSIQKSTYCFNVVEPQSKPKTPMPNKPEKESNDRGSRTTGCIGSSKSPASRLPSLSSCIPVKGGHHSSRSNTPPGGRESKRVTNNLYSKTCPASKITSSSSKSSKPSNRSKSPSPSKSSHVTKLSCFMGMRSSFDETRKSRSTSETGGKKDKMTKQLLSPYSVISKVRSSSFSGASSGHGSGSSSGKGGCHQTVRKCSNGSKAEGTSSGYESMLRDSEVTGTSSSPHDSTSESSSGGHGAKVAKTYKKKVTLTRRSRSAPARTTELSTMPRPSDSASTCSAVASTRAWVNTRRHLVDTDEPVEIKMYEFEDVERMARRREEEAKKRAQEECRLQVQELLNRQEKLKSDLAKAKDTLMLDRDTWSYDLHVAEAVDHDDPGYLEALQQETVILEKRVEMCQSRIMLVTCFDINV